MLIYCRSSSERLGVKTRQTAAKHGLFHRLHDRLKIATHETHSKAKSTAKVAGFYLHCMYVSCIAVAFIVMSFLGDASKVDISLVTCQLILPMWEILYISAYRFWAVFLPESWGVKSYGGLRIGG